MSKELEDTVKDLQKRIEKLEQKDVPWVTLPWVTPYRPPYDSAGNIIIDDMLSK
jgi:hypothetical protein